MIYRVLYFSAFLFCLFITKKLKDKSINNTLVEIYNATKEEDEERFLKALQQKGFKVFVSTFTIQFLKLKFYVNSNKYEKVQEVLKKIEIDSLKLKDRLAVNQLMFSYSVERCDYKKIHHYRDILISDLKYKKSTHQNEFVNEIELIYSIFIKKDFSIMPELELRIKAAKDTANLAVLYYYKAHLYYSKSNFSQCKGALIKSINVSNNAKWKAKINNILDSDLNQLKIGG